MCCPRPDGEAVVSEKAVEFSDLFKIQLFVRAMVRVSLEKGGLGCFVWMSLGASCLTQVPLLLFPLPSHQNLPLLCSCDAHELIPVLGLGTGDGFTPLGSRGAMRHVEGPFRTGRPADGRQSLVKQHSCRLLGWWNCGGQIPACWEQLSAVRLKDLFVLSSGLVDNNSAAV